MRVRVSRWLDSGLAGYAGGAWRLVVRAGGSVELGGWCAYIVPQGLMTLLAWPLSDRIGRRGVIYASLMLFVVITAATANRVDVFIAWRIAAGVAAAGAVPICLSLIGDVIPFERRGRTVGWMFGYIAGGTAADAALGAPLEPVIGLHGLFLAVAALSAVVIVLAALTGALLMSTQDGCDITTHLAKSDCRHKTSPCWLCFRRWGGSMMTRFARSCSRGADAVKPHTYF